MPIRNPFARRPGPLAVYDQAMAPERECRSAGFERVDTTGSKALSALSIRGPGGRDTGEYKMSGVCDRRGVARPRYRSLATRWLTPS